MANGTVANDKKKIVRDTLVAMYQEQQNMARHHETQRSTVTTIFSSLATALLAVMGALWKVGEPFDRRFLPLTLALLALGIFGYLLTMKLFERSVSHFSLSEAYLNTINTLIWEDVLDLTRERIKEITYVKKAIGKTGWDFRPHEGGRKRQQIKIIEETEQKPNSRFEQVIVEEHNPVDPREIVIPIHNEKAKYHLFPFMYKFSFARLDLFWLWEAVYMLMIIGGLVLTIIACLPERWRT
jgi:hypothetical protein